MAAHQPMIVARSSRTASPVGPMSSRRWASAWARSVTMLAPTSRRPARCTAHAGQHGR